MKVVAFNGSPRVGGNTHQLLEVVCGELQTAGVETEIVKIGGKLVHGCTACGKCFETKNGRCAIETDEVNDWIAKMLEADGILIGSPTYFADLTTETKALIDRAGYVCYGQRLLTRKVGAGVSAVRRAGAVHVLDSINHFFGINGMVTVGSCYWNLAIGRAIDDVQNDEEGLDTMRHLGQNMAWLLEKINA